jgi:uncharacterized protein
MMRPCVPACPRFSSPDAVATVLLLLSSVAVGLLIGTVGIGGVLLVPALMTFSSLSVHEAAATALFSFLFTGLVGGWEFRRRGSLDWRIAGPVCGSALLLGFAGAALGNRVPPAMMTWIIAAILFGAGVYLLFRSARGDSSTGRRSAGDSPGSLLGVGAVSGFGAGLSGAGGPLFSVPLMLALGFEPLAAVGTGQVVQIASSLSGSLGHLAGGSIRYGLAALITVAELAGTLLGVRLAHAARAAQLRLLAAALCLASAVGMAVRAGS